MWQRRRERTGRCSRERADSWESIFVQITLGFVIILGYLISDNKREVAALQGGRQEIVRQLEQQIGNTAEWREAYTAALQSPQGAIAAERDRALEELQLQRLLRAWDQVRDERHLRERLRAVRAGTAEVELAHDAQSLPQGALFEAMSRESRELFPAAIGSLEAAAVPRFIELVLERAAADSQLAGTEIAPEEPQNVRPFNPHAATPRNVQILEDVVRENLLEERLWLVDAQFRLVRDVMEARIQWLAQNAEQVETGDQQQQLTAVVGELAERMHLLDEVRLALTSPSLRR